MEINKLFKFFHLFIGLFFLLVFLGTGVYMSTNFPELYGNSEEIRMMYRSTHIYILMSSLVNIAIANYCISPSVNKLGIWFSKFASFLIMITPLIFFTAFVTEPPSYLVDRPFSFYGVLFLLIGVLLHTLINWRTFTKFTVQRTN